MSRKYRWSAQHYQSADKLPYIGLAHQGAKHTYLATGYWADGLVHGTLAVCIISDLILEQNNQWQNIYKANRHKFISGFSEFIKENANGLLQYLQDFSLPTAKDIPDIKIGEGKIIEVDREKYAISRDEYNQLHMISAVCPHMKCIVAWNSAERTWDCPCHGSHFTPTGKLIEGPATCGLACKSSGINLLRK